MNRKIIFMHFAACLFISLIYGCKSNAIDTYKQPANSFSITGSVHQMDLYPDPPPAFPDHEGKAEFMSYCGICHSLKYITMQPDFTAKTWDAEVTKMIAKYHAPIDSANAKKIVAYLVAVKGKA